MEGGGQSIGTWDSKGTLRQIVLWSKRVVRRDISSIDVWTNSSVTGHLKRVQAPLEERGPSLQVSEERRTFAHDR